jgi:hypothetical protein
MGGSDWISTGTMVQRVNFASGVVGDLERPGIRELVNEIKAQAGQDATPEALVDSCLKLLGRLDVSDETRSGLVAFAGHGESSESASPDDSDQDHQIVSILQLIVATREYQLV